MSDREEFLLERKSGIGGSDAAAIFGMSPYHTPLSLYMDKIGAYREKVTPAKEAIFERGNVLEPFLKAIFERDYSLPITSKEQSVHAKYDFIRGHVDGVVEGDNSIVEFKTSCVTSKDQWGEELTDEIPKHYLLQTHHYLLIHEEYDKAYVPVFYASPITLKILTNLVKKYGVDLNLLEDVDLQLKLYIVKRNDRIMQLMTSKYIEFWNNHVIPRIPPNWTTCEDLLLLFPNSKDEEVLADAETMRIIGNMKLKKETIEALESEIEKDKAYICGKLKDSSKLVDNEGKKIASWSEVTSKRFDQTSFKEKYAELAEQFYRSISTRTFRIF